MQKKISIKSALSADKKSFPQSFKKFAAANRYASKLEKQKFPKGFKKLEKIDHNLPSGEILGHINKNGNILISQKVPKKLRGEVAFHERIERTRLLGKPKR